MRLYQLLRTTAVVACLAAPAHADVTVYYHAGGWDAFDGQDDHGQPFCGIGSRNPMDGRTFSLRFIIGGNGVTFTASKPSWNIPDHTQIPVVMQVGLERPWTEQAAGGAQAVQWTLDRGTAQAFDAQFRQASSMTLTFPSGNEPPWIISLAGSTAISNTMGRCVTAMMQRGPAPRSRVVRAGAAGSHAAVREWREHPARREPGAGRASHADCTHRAGRARLPGRAHRAAEPAHATQHSHQPDALIAA